MTRPGTFLQSQSGAAAAEFALVLPLALLFLLGIFDVGRYVWTMNELEKAVQMGTRYAVATNVVSEGLRDLDFVGVACPSKTLVAGDTICKEALRPIECKVSGGSLTCDCTTGGSGDPGLCPANSDADSDAFQAIVQRMQIVAPFISGADVTVSYSGSGVGYAGDPATDDDGEPLSDVSPIVTVSVNPQFGMRAMTALGMSMPLPTFSYSQTLEDGDGQVAY